MWISTLEASNDKNRPKQRVWSRLGYWYVFFFLFFFLYFMDVFFYSCVLHYLDMWWLTLGKGELPRTCPNDASSIVCCISKFSFFLFFSCFTDIFFYSCVLHYLDMRISTLEAGDDENGPKWHVWSLGSKSFLFYLVFSYVLTNGLYYI